MSILYTSTRDASLQKTASQAILQGISQEGGLFVPLTFPKVNLDWASLSQASYQEVAFLILKAFLSDFTDVELHYCIDSAYSQEKFDTSAIVPLHSIGNRHFLELFHGQTIAFKDMALSILPYLMTVSAKKNGQDKKILILTATSGDTGKAAMAGFADVPNTEIIVFYPKGGVSKIQELQMNTQKGENTHVIGISGNFDDAQTAVKHMFTDEALKAEVDQLGYQFSSANSINIGRLLPQVVYYVYGYAQLVKSGTIQAGEAINIAVPTGNFGNILAAYYAKQIGLPVELLVCASNKNKVLADFFQTGTYDRKRPFYVTNSPSMDILVSSNLERLLWHASKQDSQETASLMADLADKGQYQLGDDLAPILNEFIGDFASEEEIVSDIKAVFDQDKYLLDPHTAVADVVLKRYQATTGDSSHTLIAATASPYKFPASVLEAFESVDHKADDLVLVDAIQELTGLAQPQTVQEVKNLPIRHKQVVATADMQKAVLEILKNK